MSLLFKVITPLLSSSLLTNLLLFVKNIKLPGLGKAGENLGFFASVFSTFGEILKDTLAGTSGFSLPELFGKFFTEVIPNAVTFGFEAIKSALGGILAWVKSNWVIALIAVVAGALVDLYKNNEEFRAKVQQAWEGIKEIIKSAWEAIKPIFDLFKSIITETIIPIIQNLWEIVIKPFVENVFGKLLDLWNNLLQPILDFLLEGLKTLTEMFSIFFDWFINSILGGLILKIQEFAGFLKGDFTADVLLTKNGLYDIIVEHKEEIFTFLTEVWNKIQEIWNAIKGWLEPLWTNLKQAGVDAFNLLKEGIGSALDGIKNAFSSAWSFIVGDTVDKFSELVSKVGDAVSKIGSSVSSMLSTIANGISSAWSSISSFVSSAVAKLASVVIPHFANGGVLDRPTVGLMGEYAGARTNPEIVTPESKMREVFAEGNSETNQLLDRMLGILGDIYEKDNSITIGDDVISASAARGNLAYKKRTGRSQFAI